jgi:DmsE family decaheme c-type cytochrome
LSADLKFLMMPMARMTLTSLVLLLMAAPVIAQSDNQPSDPQYSEGGATFCLNCHNTPPVSFILQTPHAQSGDPRTPFANQGCETCHGPSASHVREFSSPGVVFGKTGRRFPVSDPKTQNQACLNCHESGSRMNWQGSQHEFGDVACSSCHKIHSLHDSVRVNQTQPQVCFTCHKDKQAQVSKRSHHPIMEGLVVCSNCHNPHGSPGTTLLARNTVNETCYQCHAEKRGPFLWEHQPVREDCTNCHNPHGSTQASLLEIRPPYLCQQCHEEAFHPSTLYSGTGIPPTGAAQQLLGNSCMNCHSTIHGSNHPSGSRFTR